MLSEHSNEDTDLKSYKDTVHSVEKMGKIVATTCSQCKFVDSELVVHDYNKALILFITFIVFSQVVYLNLFFKYDSKFTAALAFI